MWAFLHIFFFSLSVWLSDSSSLLMFFGPRGSWQCHPGFSRLSRCCFWWRRDNKYLGTSFFSSPCVSCPPFSLYCWSRDPIYCRRLHQPSHLAVMFCTRVASVSTERLCSCCTCVGMPRGCVCFRVKVAAYLRASLYKDCSRCLPLSFRCVLYRAPSHWQVI